VAYEFLSEDWLAAVKELHNDYPDQRPPLEVPPLRVNLDVTGAPAEIAAEGVVHAHADTRAAALVLDAGTLADPDLTVTVDYDTAYDLLVDQRPNAAIGAFLTGRIKITGDLDRLAAEGSFDPSQIPALMAQLGITGDSALADIDPTAAQISERIRSLTR
jgi:hypothetical protein